MSTDAPIGCFVCGHELQNPAPYGPDGTFQVACRRCGTYRISEELAHDIDTCPQTDRAVLSGFCRDQHEAGSVCRLTTDHVDAILQSNLVPRTPMQKVDKLLLHIGRTTPEPGQGASLESEKDLSVAYAASVQEFSYYINCIAECGYTAGNATKLTMKGWERFEELQKRRPDSQQVFVAMSFDDSLLPAYTEGMKPLLKDMRYQPVRMDEVEHTEDIDDRMIAEIRRSRFMVADFTLQNPGVYFESGFAAGLGMTVIRTCREDELKRSHFDTRQYSHVLWNSPDDLRQRLKDRIEAVVP